MGKGCGTFPIKQLEAQTMERWWHCYALGKARCWVVPKKFPQEKSQLPLEAHNLQPQPGRLLDSLTKSGGRPMHMDPTSRIPFYSRVTKEGLPNGLLDTAAAVQKNFTPPVSAKFEALSMNQNWLPQSTGAKETTWEQGRYSCE